MPIDLWGPSLVEIFDDMKYLMFLVDNCTLFIGLYTLKNKSQVVYVFFTHFDSFVQRKFSATIKMLQSDVGTELKSLESYVF